MIEPGSGLEPAPVANVDDSSADPAPEAEPAQPERLARQVQQPEARVLVLRSGDAENYLEVASALTGHLSGSYQVREVDLNDAELREALTRTQPSAWNVAVAIGEEAAQFAASELQVLTVFCQIFEFGALIEEYDRFFGIEPLPPIKLQFESWRRFAPDATSIGIIVTEEDGELVEAARAAATDLGLDLHAAYAVTDQDAIYQFKRFAQSVDGLWLHPSREILSPTSIREILDYAASHQVQTIVFNKALLDWGALLSVSSNAEDVAASVARTVDRLLGGNAGTIDRMMPLNAVDVHINEATARQLGLREPSADDSAERVVTAAENES